MNFNLAQVSFLGVPLLISLVLGPIFIPLLKRLEIGQSIRKEGPKSHYKKSGTPTMGGIIFLLSLVITLFIFKKNNKETTITIVSTLLFGLVGFLDDFLIVVRKDNEGLKPRYKLICQFIIALIVSSLIYKYIGSELYLPFLKRFIDIKLFYIPFISFVMVATVNSVNLTDGLDGLATSVTFIVLIFFYIISRTFFKSEISDFSLILSGSILGFLFHNSYPAKVFMGDTGSMALGGAVSAIATLLKLPLIIPIVGGIYFVEALSVIIQVTSYKLRGRKVFLMSPLHHHYEQKGWHEQKVVLVFVLVTLLLAIISFMSIY